MVFSYNYVFPNLPNRWYHGQLCCKEIFSNNKMITVAMKAIAITTKTITITIIITITITI